MAAKRIGHGLASCAAVALVLAACDGRAVLDAGVLDAGVRDGAIDGASVIAIAPPSPPDAPRLAPCPEGWEPTSRLAHGMGVTSCAPALDACDGLALPSGCAPLGRTCPAGDFPDVDDPAAVYVRPGATGIGTRGSPLGTIAEAIARPDAARVVLARGVYAETVVLGRAIVLEGACATETVLAPPAGDTAVLAIAAADVVVHDLSIAADRPAIAVRGATSAARLESIGVQRARGMAIVAGTGARLEIDGARIIDVARRDERRVAAVSAADGATITARRIDVRDVETGVLARSGARVDLEDARLRCTGAGCYVGAAALLGGTLGVARSVVAGDASRALAVGADAGSRLELDGSLVISTSDAIAIEAGEGAALRIAAVRVSASSRVLRQEGGASELADVLVTDAPLADPSITSMLILGGDARLARVAWVDGPARQLAVGGTGTTVAITDLAVLGASGEPGMMLLATGAVHASVERARLAAADGFAIQSADGARVDVADLDVEALDVASPDPHAFAAVLVAATGGALTARRVRARDVQGWGVAAIQPGTTIDVEDLRFERPRLPASADMYALGVIATSEAVVRVRRAAIEGALGYAVFAGAGGSIDAADVAIDGVGAAAGAEHPAGTAAVSVVGGHVGMIGFEIAGADECGVRVLPGATIALELGAIRRSSIGACVQSPDVAPESFLTSVAFEDNDANLSVVALPVPQIAGIE